MGVAQRLAACHFDKWRMGIDAPVSTFEEVADVYGGSTPKTSVVENWGGQYAWAVPRDVTALSAPYLFDTERHITEIGLRSIGDRLHPAGSIFMTSRATIGAFAIPQQPCAANQGFIVVVPRSNEYRWFLFHEMRSRLDDMLELANGSTFLELSRGNFKKMITVHPTRTDLERLDQQLDPLHRWSASLVREVATLAELRNTIAPRLLSGQLCVHDAEAVVGEAV